MPTVSVIIPVYKSEKCLRNAVNSVLSQSYGSFEILLVDDGSPDNSLELCKKLSEEDARIKVFHKDNGGLCSARNYGIENATGKYIAFLDHDDEYMPGYLEDNINLLEKFNADFVKFGKIYRSLDRTGEIADHHDTKMLSALPFEDGVVVFRGDEIKKNYNRIRMAVKNMYIWDGIYLASVIKENGIRFDTSFKYGHEDIMFNIDIISKVNTIVYSSKEYFVHNYDNNISTSSTFNPVRVYDAIKTAKAEKELLMQWSVPEVDILKGFMNEFYRVLTMINLGKKSVSFKQKKELIMRFKNDTVATLPNLKQDVKELFKQDKKSAIWAFCFQHNWIVLIIVMYNVYRRIYVI